MSGDDTRPEVEPTHFGYRKLPADPADAPRLFQEMAGIQLTGGATFWRYTIVSPEFPLPPYPHGLYVEGFEPPPGPWRQAAFDYPITALSTPQATDSGVDLDPPMKRI